MGSALEVPKDELKKCPHCNIQIPVMVFSYAKHLQNCNARKLEMSNDIQKGISNSVHEGQKDMSNNVHEGQNEILINEKFSCSQCKTTFPSKQEHLIKVHHIYKCVKCEMVFKTLKNLQDHIAMSECLEIKNEKKEEEDENILLFCTFCDSKFNTDEQFTSHLNSISHIQAKLKTKLEEYNEIKSVEKTDFTQNKSEIIVDVDKENKMAFKETQHILKKSKESYNIKKYRSKSLEMIVGVGALINGQRVYFESTKSI